MLGRKYDRMIPHEQAVTVGANIRALRRAYGWTQAQLAGKMGWASASTVCGAEGHRDRTQLGDRRGNGVCGG